MYKTKLILFGLLISLCSSAIVFPKYTNKHSESEETNPFDELNTLTISVLNISSINKSTYVTEYYNNYTVSDTANTQLTLSIFPTNTTSPIYYSNEHDNGNGHGNGNGTGDNNGDEHGNGHGYGTDGNEGNGYGNNPKDGIPIPNGADILFILLFIYSIYIAKTTYKIKSV